MIETSPVHQLKKAAVELREEKQWRKNLMNKMTNWQRGQLLRACKGDLSVVTNDEMLFFSELPYKHRGMT